MSIFTLQPGESRPFPLSGRYLVARTVNGLITLSDPNTGLPEFLVKQSDNVEFTGSNSVVVKNVGATVATVELQSSPVRIYSNDGGSVSISGGSIDRINESINVNATAVVENGTVKSLSPATLVQPSDMNINPNQTITIMDPDPAAKRRICTVQNISETVTLIRVAQLPSANVGLILLGGMNEIASLEIETTGILRVYNASPNPAKVAVAWGTV